MKKFCKKLSELLRIAFGYSILLCLFAGSLLFLGYVVAMFIGGDTAAEICRVISKEITPWLIKIASVTVLVGILAMYLGGEVALNAKKK